MIYTILSFISSFILWGIDAFGYAGIFVLMLLESAGIPVPSEIIMPFSGFLVSTGSFNFWLVVFLGTAGNLVGSLILYAVGFYGGRGFVLRYGKYIFFSERELEVSEQWFEKYGSAIAFFGRLLPIVRTYISFPAGLARMNLWKFSLYTTLGVAPWAYLFTWIGVKLGERWQEIEVYARKFDILIGALIIMGIIWFVWKHVYEKTNNS